MNALHVCCFGREQSVVLLGGVIEELFSPVKQGDGSRVKPVVKTVACWLIGVIGFWSLFGLTISGNTWVVMIGNVALVLLGAIEAFNHK